MTTLREVVDLVHGWYPPDLAEPWDAVGLAYGDPAADVRRVLLAVDPVLPVAEEAAEWGADLVLTHHPLFLKPVHGFAATTPKGRTLKRLSDSGCALLAAHTNADRAVGGVSEALALALGLADPVPILGDTGRRGAVQPTTLAAFARAVAAALPDTVQGVRVAGDPQRRVSSVAVLGGAGDFLLDEMAGSDVDVYVTSDLRHHPASEFVEKGGPALVDVAHWAAEWTWLPVLETRLREALGEAVEVRVSTLVTDPWQFRVSTLEGRPRHSRA